MKLKFIKLITGELIVCQIINELDSSIEVDNALVFDLYKGVFIPYDILFENSKFNIDHKDILREELITKQSIKEMYNKAILQYNKLNTEESDIVLPNNKIIMH